VLQKGPLKMRALFVFRGRPCTACATIRAMRIAALYDIHGNLPALDAVLAEVEVLAPDAIVIGGDVAPGPMVAETIARLRGLGERARFVMGNGDRELVAAIDAGTTPEAAGDDLVARFNAWAAQGLDRADRDFLAAFAATVTVEVDGLGPVLFCHGSPRSDDERITRATPQERLAPMLEGVSEPVVVCGHTHQQFDLRCGAQRVLNAGSVGMPYEGTAAAFWLLLGPDAELRRTDYDVPAAVATMRATGMPDVDKILLQESLIEPVDPDWVTRYFETGEQ
jgi:predicted phosphodiesterase